MFYVLIISACVLASTHLGAAFSNSEWKVDSLHVEKASFSIPRVKRNIEQTSKVRLLDNTTKLGIIGGLTTNITEHPYQISIDSGKTFVCSGALLNRIWVVTLASCAAGAQPSDFIVRVGSNSNTYGGTVFNVTEIVVHPNYNYTNMDYDFAMLKLNTYICFDPNSGSIQFSSSEPLKNAKATISGWGTPKRPTSQGPLQEAQFHQLTMKVLSNTACQNRYSISHDEITPRMFCATAGNKGPCYNDFGDPLVINDTLYGLYSWSRGCADPDYPAVFSDLSSVADWIYTVMNNACMCGIF